MTDHGNIALMDALYASEEALQTLLVELAASGVKKEVEAERLFRSFVFHVNNALRAKKRDEELSMDALLGLVRKRYEEDSNA